MEDPVEDHPVLEAIDLVPAIPLGGTGPGHVGWAPGAVDPGLDETGRELLAGGG